MTNLNASRRKFLRTASVVSGSVGAAAAPFALNLATLGSAVAPDAPALQGDRLPVLVRRQRRLEHGAAHRRDLVQRLHPDAHPGARLDRAAGARARRRTRTPRGPRRRASAASLPIAPKFTPACRVDREQRLHLRPASDACRRSQSLFGAGRLAILANAGPLVAPMTKAAVPGQHVPRPRALGSHNDQQSTWQALGPEGVKVGWGGHLGDLVASSNANAAFTSITVSGNAVFSAGDTVFQYQVGGDGAVQIGGHHRQPVRLVDRRGDAAAASSPPTTSTCSPTSTRRSSSARSTAQASFQTAFAASTVRGADAPTSSRRPATRRPTAWRSSCRRSPASSARAARSASTRQVFFVVDGRLRHPRARTRARPTCWRGSRTRSATSTRRWRTLGGVDMRNNVTLFTASDFGRTHHQQRRRHRPRLGRAPLRRRAARSTAARSSAVSRSSAPQGADSAGNQYLPSTSVDQIGATIGKWFGATPSQLNTIFPNLPNFSTPRPRLSGLTAERRRRAAATSGRREHAPVLDRFGEVRPPDRRRCAGRSAIVRATAQHAVEAARRPAEPRRRRLQEARRSRRRARQWRSSASPASSRVDAALARERDGARRGDALRDRRARLAVRRAPPARRRATVGTSTCRSMRSSSGPLMPALVARDHIGRAAAGMRAGCRGGRTGTGSSPRPAGSAPGTRPGARRARS